MAGEFLIPTFITELNFMNGCFFANGERLINYSFIDFFFVLQFGLRSNSQAFVNSLFAQRFCTNTTVNVGIINRIKQTPS